MFYAYVEKCFSICFRSILRKLSRDIFARELLSLLFFKRFFFNFFRFSFARSNGRTWCCSQIRSFTRIITAFGLFLRWRKFKIQITLTFDLSLRAIGATKKSNIFIFFLLQKKKYSLTHDTPHDVTWHPKNGILKKRITSCCGRQRETRAEESLLHDWIYSILRFENIRCSPKSKPPIVPPI